MDGTNMEGSNMEGTRTGVTEEAFNGVSVEGEEFRWADEELDLLDLWESGLTLSFELI